MAQITLNSTGVASSGSLALQSNGTTTAVTIDASQNVGIGTTPSAWGTGNGILQLGNSSVWGATSSAVAHFSNNTYFDGTNYKAILTGSATDHYQIAGTYVWRYANSLTAGGTISSWIEAMRIDASGNVGIGTNSPSYKLQVNGVISSNDTVQATSGTTVNVLSTAGGGEGVVGTSSNHALQFRTNNTERARIDSSGNVLVTSAASLGYGTGSGGTVTQATSKSTSVTLNKPAGQITMNNAALAAGATIQFVCNNTLVSLIDTVVVTINAVTPSAQSAYNIWAYANAGQISFNIKNISGTSYSDALTINFTLIKGASS